MAKARDSLICYCIYVVRACGCHWLPIASRLFFSMSVEAVRAPPSCFGSRVSRSCVVFGLFSQDILRNSLSKKLGFKNGCGPLFYATDRRLTAILGACGSTQLTVSERCSSCSTLRTGFLYDHRLDDKCVPLSSDSKHHVEGNTSPVQTGCQAQAKIAITIKCSA